MKDAFDHLFRLLGTQAAVAKALGYTDRQYLNIRRKVERGEKLHPRVASFLQMRIQMIEGPTPVPPYTLATNCNKAIPSMTRMSHGA
jgi:hypothetical protein